MTDEWCEGYAAAMNEAAAILRETSRREIEGKPGDFAYPLGAVGRWFRDIATSLERRRDDVKPKAKNT